MQRATAKQVNAIGDVLAEFVGRVIEAAEREGVSIRAALRAEIASIDEMLASVSPPTGAVLRMLRGVYASLEEKIPESTDAGAFNSILRLELAALTNELYSIGRARP